MKGLAKTFSAQPTTIHRALPGFSSIKRYIDKSNNSITAKILPGEFYVTTQNELITTVLGSCVSACIRDKVFGIGGMNHFMLPLENEDSSNEWRNAGMSAATRYGNVAMEYLINSILKHGGTRQNLEVKLFGGGKILAKTTDVGARNVEFVLHYLNIEGLSIDAQDLGDIYPRKVIYNPLSGKVRMKKLKSLHNNTIVDRENAYLQDLGKKPEAGEIDLF
ncbi:MAG: chemoreceptor glutamine deamidase CheD [Gammaproteobacteria bacterium]|nr:chemoreceptor glutamine deamidase CheD [Gammaproteobacteria bacterium]